MKTETKSKTDKTKTEKSKTLYEEENVSNNEWSNASQDDIHVKEIVIDRSKMEDIENTRKDDDSYFNDKSNLDCNFGGAESKQEDTALIEIANNTNTSKKFFRLYSIKRFNKFNHYFTEYLVDRPSIINSQLPDLLNGTEIDRCYFNLGGDKGISSNKSESLPDWEDSLKYLMMRSNAEDSAKQFRKTDELFAFNNLTLNGKRILHKNMITLNYYY